MNLDFLEPLLSAEDAARADRHTIDALGVSGSELMERAGLAVAHEAERLLAQVPSPGPSVPVVVVCGPGNNGGDGWVAARRLWQNGVRTALISLIDPDQLKNEAANAAKHFASAASNELWTLPNLDACAQYLTSASQILDLLDRTKPAIVIDAIFGTGLKRPVDGHFAEAISAMATHKAKHNGKIHILSVDIPSGLPSDGERWSDIHVHADSTLAIQYRKITHLSGPHWLSCGVVTRVDIGIKLPGPPTALALLADKQPCLTLLRPPQRQFHKGSYGHVGVLYGTFGIHGASELCSYSALRSGAGLVTLLIPAGTKTETNIASEIMRRIIPSPLEIDSLERFSSLVIGTGVGHNRYETAFEILTWALANSRPIVVDAGALPLLKSLDTNAQQSHSQIIATPHPGETARLLNASIADVEFDRISTAQALLQLSAQWPSSVTWVLKGSCPIVADPRFGLVVCEGGVSTLAVGGSGDVLSGLCGALFGQTHSAFGTALLGVTTHLEVGRRLAQTQSRGFFAHEIADEIPKILFGR